MLHIIAGAGIAREDDPLVALHEGQGGQIQDLVLVQSGLEVEVEVGQELSLRQLAVPDPALNAAFGEGPDLEVQQAGERPGQVKVVLVGPGQFPVDDLLQGKQLQAVQLAPDRFRLRVHGASPPEVPPPAGPAEAERIRPGFVV